MDESESEAEVNAEEEKQVQKEEKKEAKSAASHKHDTTPLTAPSAIKGQQKIHARSAEEVRTKKLNPLFLTPGVDSKKCALRKPLIL